MLASDDPDSYGTNNFYHLFRNEGLARGSAQKVSDLYYQAVTAYQRGDRQAASKYVGLLSHYYADTLQPFHADYRALAYQSGSSNLHTRYELAVDDYNRYPGAHASWVTPRSRHGVSDVRRKTVSAAYYSRARFSRLLAGLKRSSSVTTGDTNLVTRRGHQPHLERSRRYRRDNPHRQGTRPGTDHHQGDDATLLSGALQQGVCVRQVSRFERQPDAGCRGAVHLEPEFGPGQRDCIHGCQGRRASLEEHR